MTELFDGKRNVRAALNQSHILVRLLPYAALLIGIVLVPILIFKPSPEGQNYFLTVLILVGINTILAVGLNLLMGYAGQVSLGHAAFYGIGAYVSAMLTTQGLPKETVVPASTVVAVLVATAAVIALLRVESLKLGISVVGFIVPAYLLMRFGPHHWAPYAVAVVFLAGIPLLFQLSPWRLLISYALGSVVGVVALVLLNKALASQGISPWYAMLAGAFFACLIAYLIGVQALRLHGYYLAMATLGFGVIVFLVFLHWEPTGGTSGIYGIPNLSIAGKALKNDVSMYYLVWALVTIVIALSANIVHSRVGRAFRAVHGSETAAATLGVDTARYKVQVFVLSAALAAVAGSLYAHYVTFISPEPFGFKFSIELVVMVVVGGMASIWGAIFGAGLITVLGEILRTLSQKYGEAAIGQGGLASFGLSLSDFDVIVFGLILMLIMIYLPAGLTQGVLDLVKSTSRLVRPTRGPQPDGEV